MTRREPGTMIEKRFTMRDIIVERGAIRINGSGLNEIYRSGRVDLIDNLQINALR